MDDGANQAQQEADRAAHEARDRAAAKLLLNERLLRKLLLRKRLLSKLQPKLLNSPHSKRNKLTISNGQIRENHTFGHLDGHLDDPILLL